MPSPGPRCRGIRQAHSTFEINTPGSWIPNGWLEWSEPPTMLSPSGPPALGKQISWGCRRHEGPAGPGLSEHQRSAPQPGDVQVQAAAVRPSGMGVWQGSCVGVHRGPLGGGGDQLWGKAPASWGLNRESVDTYFPPGAVWTWRRGRSGQGDGWGLTSTGYGPSRAAASRLGAILRGPGSPGVTVITVVAAAVGAGGECGRGLGRRGPPAPRSSNRAMAGDAAVSRATAWSCLASVMSTPLICKNVAS